MVEDSAAAELRRCGDCVYPEVRDLNDVICKATKKKILSFTSLHCCPEYKFRKGAWLSGVGLYGERGADA